MTVKWIELDGLVNLRDVGGMPTTVGGRVREARLLRSDNLQDLTPHDIEHLLSLGLSDVVDLRSNYEVLSAGPGPLVGHQAVTIHHHSYMVESASDAPDEIISKAMPKHDTSRLRDEVPDAFAASYVGFVLARPDSVLGALRAVANARGAALVHCAAGKDRTGVTVALSLMLAGVERAAIVDEYALSRERMTQIVERLLSSTTYAYLADRPVESHMTHPESMDAFLGYLEGSCGGAENFLATIGWTADDTGAMRQHLLG